MNAQKLARLNADNGAAKLYFATFATRRRSFAQTTIQDVVDLARRQGRGLSPATVEAFFEGLQAAECGQIVRDAAGIHFDWLHKAMRVAQIALETPLETTAQTAQTQAPAPVKHELRLRDDWTLTLELPADFSADEAKRLCHFVKALPLQS